MHTKKRNTSLCHSPCRDPAWSLCFKQMVNTDIDFHLYSKRVFFYLFFLSAICNKDLLLLFSLHGALLKACIQTEKTRLNDPLFLCYIWKCILDKMRNTIKENKQFVKGRNLSCIPEIQSLIINSGVFL